MKTKEEILADYVADVAPLFSVLFPLLNGAAICSKKIELRAYRDKLKTKQQRKRDLSTIEQTAARLYALCDKYTADYLHTQRTTEDERDHATLVLIENSNLFIYFLLRLQNALIAGADKTTLLQLDTLLKLAAKNCDRYDLIKEATFENFDLWKK